MGELAHMVTCLFALVLLNSPTPTKAAFVQDYCTKAGIEYEICISILESDPKASSAKSLLELGEVMSPLATKTASNARSLILHGDRRVPPNTLEALSTCDGLYGEALARLEQASNDFAGRKFVEAAISFSQVSESANSCHKAMLWVPKRPEEVVEFMKQNDVVEATCKLGYSVMSDLRTSIL